MERELLRKRLARADVDIRQGYGRIDTQLDLVNRFESSGLSSASARSLLMAFVEVQSHLLLNRERLAEALAATDAASALKIVEPT
jgi:hypothetical protein